MASPNDLREPLPEARIPQFQSTSTVRAPGPREAFAGRGNSGVFDAIANVLPQVVEGSDLILKKDISQSLNDAVDQVNAEYGVDGRLFGQDVTDKNQLNTEEMQRASETIADIHQGYQSGRIADSHYWARLDSISRQLRTRYPGHREFIDQKIASIVGSTPANRLREEMAAEAKAKANGDGVERDPFAKGNNKIIEEYVSSGLIDSVLGPQWQDKVASGDWDVWEVGRLLRAHKGRYSQIENAKTELGYLNDQGKMDEGKLYETARLEITNNYLTATSTAFKPVVAARLDLEKLVESGLSANRPMNEQEQLALKQGLNNFNIQAQKGIQAMLNQDNGGWSYSVKLSPEHINAIWADFDRQKKVFDDVVANPSTGMLNQLKDYLENFQKGDQLSLLQNDKAIREMGAMGMLPPEVQSMLLLKAGTYDEVAQKAMKGVYRGILENRYDSLAAGLAAETADIMGDPVLSAKEKNKKLADTASLATQSAIDIINNPKTTADVLDKTIKGSFGVGNNNYLRMFTNPDMKREYYYKMVNPEMAAHMYSMRTSHPEYWDLYKNWSKNSFMSLFTQHAAELKAVAANRKYINLTFDGKHYDLEATKPKTNIATEMWKRTSFPGLAGLEDIGEARFEANARTAIRSFNTAIDGFNSVLAMEGGDVTKEIRKVLVNEMGIDPGIQKEPTVADQVFESFADMVFRAVAKTMSPKNSLNADSTQPGIPDVPPDQNKIYQLVE